MERSTLGFKRTDRVSNTMMRSITGISDMRSKIDKLKWYWTGHVGQMPPEMNDTYLLKMWFNKVGTYFLFSFFGTITDIRQNLVMLFVPNYNYRQHYIKIL